MSIFKIHKRDNPFVQIDKTAIMDKSLSWKATGILAYLLSRPDDWQVYEKEITKHAKDGRDSVRSGIQELIECGYIEREPKRDEHGKFRGYDYNVYETPNRDGKSDIGKSDIGESALTNIELSDKEYTKNKRYIITGADDPAFEKYSSRYYEYFGKRHPTVTEEQLSRLCSVVNDINSKHDIDWDEVIDDHFMSLPPHNDGNILYFLHGDAAAGVIRRYVK